MITAAGADVCVVTPVVVALNLPARGQPIGAGLVCVDGQGVTPGPGQVHGVGLIIVTVIPNVDQVAVEWLDSLLGDDAVTVGVGRRNFVSAVQVGEHFSGGNVG